MEIVVSVRCGLEMEKRETRRSGGGSGGVRGGWVSGLRRRGARKKSGGPGRVSGVRVSGLRRRRERQRSVGPGRVSRQGKREFGGSVCNQ